MESEPDTPWGLRNRARLALGYELLTRRSELIVLRNQDVGPRSDGTLRVLIRHRKADPYGQGRIAFTSRRTADMLRDWLDYRGPEIEWLFCPIYRSRVIDRCLETTTVRRVIKEAARRCGLRPDLIASFSGHSMRVGAAQDLLKWGVDTAAIMRAGGWKSVNVLARYLEKAEHNVWQSLP
ncbi:tyrosine-type recombinase/integrase [Qipengyuania sp.]|uniref:tyrosine-type recombinase/integrase n=1 Tax=Qipengyuania sp. TaxID=2004515 RepID=UPI003BAB29B5